MRDQPDGALLLAEARRVLLEEILDDLPDSQRFNGLMVANAMAIARRELEAASAALPESDEIVAVEEIRRGRRDGEAALHETLVKDVRNRVLLSNPKYLEKNVIEITRVSIEPTIRSDAIK